MNSNAITEPIFFAPNRVWRCYTGGVLLDRFVGVQPGRDGHEPEDWLASAVRALNGDFSRGPTEGVARTLTADGRPGPLISEWLERDAEALLGKAHVARYGKNPGVLCKYLDSAVRLPIQCHPDVALAERLYRSSYGKAECWYIIDTRKVRGEQPYLLLGFKPGVTKAAFAEAVEAQNIPAMENMLHKIRCKPGQMFFLPGRFPHAIGPGVFMVETQEPSDWVVQCERYCADTRLSDENMWGPLTREQGMDIFDYAGMTEADMLQRSLTAERVVHSSEGGRVVELIGRAQTPAFAVQRVTVSKRLNVTLPRGFGIVVVTEGEGTMRWGGRGEREIRRGQYFLQPAGMPSVEYTATAAPLTLLLCLPPEA